MALHNGLHTKNQNNISHYLLQHKKKNQSNWSLLYLRILITHTQCVRFCFIMPSELFHFDFCWHFSWPLLSLDRSLLCRFICVTVSFIVAAAMLRLNAAYKTIENRKHISGVVKSNLPKAQSSNALLIATKQSANINNTKKKNVQIWQTTERQR